MLKLETPFGSCYLKARDVVEAIGAPRASKKFPEPTRELILACGKSLYIADSEQNLAMFGLEFDEPKPEPKKKRGGKANV